MKFKVILLSASVFFATNVFAVGSAGSARSTRSYNTIQDLKIINNLQQWTVKVFFGSAKFGAKKIAHSLEITSADGQKHIVNQTFAKSFNKVLVMVEGLKGGLVFNYDRIANQPIAISVDWPNPQEIQIAVQIVKEDGTKELITFGTFAYDLN